MTGRERLLKTFKREKVDRIPIAPFLYYCTMYEFFDYKPRMDEFFDPEDFDVTKKFVDYCDYFGFDVLHVLGTNWDGWSTNWEKHTYPSRSADNWDVTVIEEGDEDSRRIVITIKTPEGELRQVENKKRSSQYLIVRAIDEYLWKTPKDFEIFRKYSPPLDNIDCSLIARAREAVGDKGLVNANTGGVINVMNAYRKLDQIFMDPFMDEGFYREMCEYLLEWIIRQDKKMVEAGGEVLEFAANLTTSGVGPDFFEKYVLEYDKRKIDAVHAAGAFVNYHNCGDSAKLLHLYNQLGTDSFGYLTPPPFGDVDLNEALRVLRPDMVLKGNIDQVEFLRTATPGQIKKRVKEVLDKVKKRGNFILSTTDFIFDGTSQENVKAFVEAGIEYGTY